MRRSVTIAALFALTISLVPVASAVADDCPTISGRANLDFGGSGTGFALVTLGGERLRVPFTETAFGDTVEFTWHFPAGDVFLKESATVTPIAGPVVRFDSDVAVVGGGSGAITWSGVANVASGRAVFTLEGTLCVGTGT